jgi:disease resistance protein RPM1
LAPPPHRLEALDLLAWYFTRIPRWLAELHNLSYLELSITEAMEEDLGILGKLPSLMHLQFQIQQAPTEKIVIHGSMGLLFQSLLIFSSSANGECPCSF